MVAANAATISLPTRGDLKMARRDKSAYTDKQKRKARHIEKGYEDRGVGEEESARRAWATVNQETGGGKIGGKASASRTKAERSASAKKAARTRRKRASGT